MILTSYIFPFIFAVLIPFKRNVVDPKVKNPNSNTKSNVNKKEPKKIFGLIQPFWLNKRPKRGETRIQKECKKLRPLCLDSVHKKENSENFKDKKEGKNRNQSIDKKFSWLLYVEYYFNLFFLLWFDMMAPQQQSYKINEKPYFLGRTFWNNYFFLKKNLNSNF